VKKASGHPHSVPTSRRVRRAHEHRRRLSITTSGSNPLANAAALAAEQRLDPHADVILEAPAGREKLKRTALKPHHSTVRVQPARPPPLIQRLPLMSEARVQRLLSKFVSAQAIGTARHNAPTQDVVDDQVSIQQETAQVADETRMQYETITIIPSSTGYAPRVIHSSIPPVHLLSDRDHPSIEQDATCHAHARDHPASEVNADPHSTMRRKDVCRKGRAAPGGTVRRPPLGAEVQTWHSIASRVGYAAEQKEESNSAAAPSITNSDALTSAWGQRTQMHAQKQTWDGMMVGKGSRHRSLSPPRSRTRPPANRTSKPFASVRKRIQQMPQPSVVNKDVHAVLQVHSARHAGEGDMRSRLRPGRRMQVFLKPMRQHDAQIETSARSGGEPELDHDGCESQEGRISSIRSVSPSQRSPLPYQTGSSNHQAGSPHMLSPRHSHQYVRGWDAVETSVPGIGSPTPHDHHPRHHRHISFDKDEEKMDDAAISDHPTPDTPMLNLQLHQQPMNDLLELKDEDSHPDTHRSVYAPAIRHSLAAALTSRTALHSPVALSGVSSSSSLLHRATPNQRTATDSTPHLPPLPLHGQMSHGAQFHSARAAGARPPDVQGDIGSFTARPSMATTEQLALPSPLPSPPLTPDSTSDTRIRSSAYEHPARTHTHGISAARNLMDTYVQTGRSLHGSVTSGPASNLTSRFTFRLPKKPTPIA